MRCLPFVLGPTPTRGPRVGFSGTKPRILLLFLFCFSLISDGHPGVYLVVLKSSAGSKTDHQRQAISDRQFVAGRLLWQAILRWKKKSGALDALFHTDPDEKWGDWKLTVRPLAAVCEAQALGISRSLGGNGVTLNQTKNRPFLLRFLPI